MKAEQRDIDEQVFAARMGYRTAQTEPDAWFKTVNKCPYGVACHAWLQRNGYPEAPRSACIGCPYRHMREWRRLKEESEEEWQDAVEFDKAVRKCGGMRGDVFIHSDRIPLDEVNLYKDFDKNQLSLWQDECEGMCGV